MVRRLIEAGYKLVVYDVSPQSVEAAVALGAQAADSPKEVADAAEIVLASLPTPPIVEQIALGPNGVSEGSKVRIFVDTSTTGSIYANRIAKGLAARNITQADAPISGGVTGANKGTLAVMLACPESMREKLEPILKPLGKVFYLGSKPGQGQTMKLLNNILSAAAMSISSEAAVIGVKAGLEPRTMLDVINHGTGRNSATEDKIPRLVLPRKFNGGFAVGLLNKDVRLCLEEAEALGIPMVVGTAIKQLLALTVATLGPDADMSEIIRAVELWGGVEVSDKPAAVAANQLSK